MEKLKKLVPYLIIAGFAIVALIPLLFCDYYVGHDIYYHLEAISSLNVSWNETHSIARIYDIICQDYGYGTGLFYSMIPALICVTLINVFHLSALNALVVEIFIIRYLSGVVMYLLIKRIFGNSPIATFVAGCYIIFPYFLTNLNVRFAFSEIFIMLTLPIVALGVWELFNNNQRVFIPLFTLGCSLTLLIHFTLGVYLAIILAILFVINYKQIFSWTKIISICISFGLILMIALGFIIPMLVNYGEINLRSMARSGESLFNSVLSIFHEDYLVPSTIFALVAYVLFFIVYLKKRDKAKIEKRFFIFVNIIYVFASPICPWYWLGFAPFSMIQFVWRLFNFVAIIVAIMIGYVLINVKKRWLVNLIKLGLLSCVVIILVMNITYVFCHYGNVQKSEDAFMSDYSALTSNEGTGSGKSGDYYPNGTNKEYLFNRVNDNVVLDSTVEVSELADYQSINQINFVVKNRNKNSIDYVVLKIPFIVCENIKIVEIQTTNPFSTNEISPSYATFNGVDYLKIALDSVYDESKIVINYDSCNDFKSYLRQNPFDFIITTGNATCSQFYKNNSHDYTVRIDTTEYSVIELPTLAYRGYKFVYETGDGVITELNGVHGENGFIEITVSTSGNLHVYFEGKYVKIANALSISGGVLLVIVCIYLFILPEQIRVKTRDFCFKIMKRNKTN